MGFLSLSSYLKPKIKYCLEQNIEKLMPTTYTYVFKRFKVSRNTRKTSELCKNRCRKIKPVAVKTLIRFWNARADQFFFLLTPGGCTSIISICTFCFRLVSS